MSISLELKKEWFVSNCFYKFCNGTGYLEYYPDEESKKSRQHQWRKVCLCEIGKTEFNNTVKVDFDSLVYGIENKTEDDFRKINCMLTGFQKVDGFVRLKRNAVYKLRHNKRDRYV